MVSKNKKTDLMISVIITVAVSVLAIIGLCCHEPWFDEAQAYLLAKNSSWSDVLTHWTHYEGHPPMWHILLKCAASLGLSFEATIKSVNFIFVEAVLLLIQFRSPFSRITKTIIPLSFFLLYQYSVISRPYMMLTFSCLLAAMCYRDRHEKPLRYCLALIFICTVHSYGIAFAGGIVLSDMIGEAIRERSVKKMCTGIISNKKLLFSYIILLAAAMAMIAAIMPHSDTYAAKQTVSESNHSLPVCYLFSWLLIPSENLFTSFSSELLYMREEVNPVGEVITAGAISFLIWAVLFVICRKRRMVAELFIPYSFIAVLTSLHISPHHFGIFFMYLLFILWTATDKEPVKMSEFTQLAGKAGMSESFTKKIIIGTAAAFSAINIYWDALSYYREIKLPYDPAPALAEWIKDNGAENKKLLTTWAESDIFIVNASSIVVNAYFDRNVYYNLNYDLPFITHIVVDDDERKATVNKWKQAGKPDLMICDTPNETAFICSELGIENDYSATAYVGKGRRIFKDKCDIYNVYVMCSKDTYKEIYGQEYAVSTY